MHRFVSWVLPVTFFFTVRVRKKSKNTNGKSRGKRDEEIHDILEIGVLEHSDSEGVIKRPCMAFGITSRVDAAVPVL
jgi:hypothetical protein